MPDPFSPDIAAVARGAVSSSAPANVPMPPTDGFMPMPKETITVPGMSGLHPLASATLIDGTVVVATMQYTEGKDRSPSQRLDNILRGVGNNGKPLWSPADPGKKTHPYANASEALQDWIDNNHASTEEVRVTEGLVYMRPNGTVEYAAKPAEEKEVKDVAQEAMAYQSGMFNFGNVAPLLAKQAVGLPSAPALESTLQAAERRNQAVSGSAEQLGGMNEVAGGDAIAAVRQGVIESHNATMERIDAAGGLSAILDGTKQHPFASKPGTSNTNRGRSIRP